MTNELIDYRRNRAKETLNDAEQLFNSGSLFSSVNRIYYAMFYEVTALLLIKGLAHIGFKVKLGIIMALKKPALTHLRLCFHSNITT